MRFDQFSRGDARPTSSSPPHVQAFAYWDRYSLNRNPEIAVPEDARDVPFTSATPRTTRLRHWLGPAAAALALLMTGCASETLFQSSFNSNAIGAPPAHAQATGTIDLSGEQNSVVVVGPVPNSSENWVRISRNLEPNNQALITVMQGTFSNFRGDGTYGFVSALFIPSGSGLATVEFDTAPQGSPPSAEFLHLDFLQNNTVRINDDPNITFGTFPRDQFFTLSVSMDISATSAVAHMALFGNGASGTMDYKIPFLSLARQYGEIKLWMGFPWTGSFDATDILVTRKTQ